MLGKPRVPHLLRHKALDGEALYRVVGVSGDSVEVEVVSAPGLTPGTRVHFTQAAVARMSVVAQAARQRGEQAPATGNRTPGSAGATHRNR
jgi:hypothetical protein